jgi:hypothetical protein
MLVIIGIILLLLWLIDYAVHPGASSLVDLLLIFAAISFGLDYLRGRSGWDRRPNWDHRPSTAHRRRMTLAARWVRNRFRGPQSAVGPDEESEPVRPTRPARGQA